MHVIKILQNMFIVGDASMPQVLLMLTSPPTVTHDNISLVYHLL